MTECRRHKKRGSRRRASRGFTLTEMLVVIAIIGVLASLITVAGMRALDTGKQVAIKSELDQLDSALKDFKNKYGAYPPCDLSINGTMPGSSVLANVNPALQSFIMRAFPRYNLNNLASDWNALGVDSTYAHPDRALVFWLSGFSPDVTSPFTGAGARTPFFAFDPTRLYNMTLANTVAQTASATTGYIQYLGQIAYVPKYGNGTPYVYIDSGNYGNLPVTSNVNGNYSYISSVNSNGNYVNSEQSSTTTPTISSFAVYNITAASSGTTTAGTVTPYVQDLQSAGTYVNSGATTAYQFCNPTTFQLISAGQDGQYGTSLSLSGFTNGRLYPGGSGYSADGSDIDNAANFCDKSRLGDVIP
jgi:prepilin-type N-terminal cleavage/methylation domain-containing protein